MTIESWLKSAVADAEHRKLPELVPILETLAKATQALRGADFNQSPVSSPQSSDNSHQS